jgi:putative phosphonate metabolism protein
MGSFPRYAIYYASAAGIALDRFGAELLGYDARSGEDLPFPDGILREVPDWHALTQDPRKYGFHATLKAPFALAPGKTEAGLVDACADFADRARPAPVITPVVGAISGFIAVIPEERSDELERFAADCVSAFDSFRAPLTAEERAQRNPQRLTPRQCAYLDRWGYPYVMDEFRFHMTLTGRLEPARREAVLAMLRDRFANIGPERLAIDRVAVFCQNHSHSRFRILKEWKLRVLP